MDVLDSKKSRNLTIDVLRGLAVILMVVGHCIEIGSGADYFRNEDFYNSQLHDFIYAFHLPLFAIISGYVFYWSCNKNFVEIIKRKVLTLVVPMLSWATLDALITFLYSAIIDEKLPGMAMLIKYGAKTFLFYYWFLWTVFLCSVVVAIIEKVGERFNQYIKVVGYIIVVIVTYCLPNTYFTKHYFMFPFFILGYIANKSRIISRYNMQKSKYTDWIIFFGCVSLFALSIRFFDKSVYVYVSGTSILPMFSWGGYSAVDHLLIDFFRIWIGILGSIIAYIIVNKIISLETLSKSLWIRCVAWIGANSMGIYIISLYCNILIRRLTVNLYPNFVFWICESLIVIVLCSTAVVGIKKIRVLSQCLLGNI